MKKINIDSLSLNELIELNKLVVEKINFLREFEAMKSKIFFEKGDPVSFEHKNRYFMGIVVKKNIKTVSVLVENGEVWRVSPAMLKKVVKVR